ncbi:hypothetical protein GCM10022278_01700 [Allohahella marinimesophila]|uniref:Uncharacterized protein n=1 Tax=Allohahella marinimesophila TaxID=1054972 RepID=A0ABP7NJE7_9GAMM
MALACSKGITDTSPDADKVHNTMHRGPVSFAENTPISSLQFVRSLPKTTSRDALGFVQAW